MDLNSLVRQQIALTENGKPLEAFVKFFSDKVKMRNNDVVFANSKMEGLELQTAFMSNITEFKANVFYDNLKDDLSTLGVAYSFKNEENLSISFKGVHKQRWENELIVSEDFYTGEFLNFPEIKGL